MLIFFEKIVLTLFNMVYINNSFDVTLTAPGTGIMPALQSSAVNTAGKTFSQAQAINRVYAGNGLICQQNMCQSLTGCDSKLGCPEHPDWKKVQQFCGPIGTQQVAMDGAIWQLENSDTQQQLLSATQKSTGMAVLPTAYNVTGMY